jgi:hypothetical protein
MASVFLFCSLSDRPHSTAAAALGSDIAVGTPFSQMTSSTSVNGLVVKVVQLAMPVQGSRGQGVASVEVKGG